MKLSELAEFVNGKLVPQENGNLEIKGVAALRDADSDDLSFHIFLFELVLLLQYQPQI
jgi:hypothetical protein